ncbi:MAG: YraN family protein [Candidatus Lloydbacteria bacterium CG22_combo_CG10-13_8_21_14_all_47_15]|uniref:UPF0102 protein COW88_01290 n=1 Tax=Candidatus Lloydbacteria bacterium CG22_combo_CG10-13_8_21_14_all_47_15 TaxID=1974635 RepID=A0A2H0CUP2_9BACT|nr:MAG: YraN family protein [Candidatus Lloydbacteria bacterium CG22_combo_CG10-13_8_21_14_all_47_15]
MFNEKRFSRSEIGKIGENIACRYLEKHNHKVICRNYRKKWGEIDIITIEGKTLRFVEVKTVSCKTTAYQPEENVHIWKQRRLYRTIQSYVLEKNCGDIPWQCDVVAVFLNLKDKIAKIRYTENIVL